MLYNTVMYIERVPNRNSPAAVLLRESYREDGKVKKRTLSNLSALPDHVIEIIRSAIKGQSFVPTEGGLSVDKTRSHGHVAAIVGVMKKLGLPNLIASQSSRQRDLILAMIASRILEPTSKLATSRLWHTNTIADEFGVADAEKDELYGALGWLGQQQVRIERKLLKRHVQEGALVMFDLTSTYLEGRCCPLAKHGYSRDHRSDRLQIEFGLLTDRDGRPLAVEVFEGNTADPSALSSQVNTLRERHGFRELIIVGDRGMITQARIDNDLAPNQLFWISALRNDAIKRLAEGPLQPSLFDERNLVEIASPDYPDERLTACRNPFLADERARNRRELLEATETGLRKVQEAIAAGRLKECGAIGRWVEGTLRRFKMAKHFHFEIKDGQFVFSRNEENIAAEAALDGIYVIRTNVPKERLDAVESVRQYKGLARVERAFRTIKSGLDVRPVFHHLTDRVHAHIFLCMLAYYVEWEMRNKLAPLLFSDESPSQNGDPVAPAQPSETAKTKAGKRLSLNGFQLHSFRTLIQDLGTLARSWITPKIGDSQGVTFTMLTQPTPLQQEAFRLLGVTV
jgi:hypothetical protein